MDYRLLGGSGFMVPALSLGTGTFGGGNAFFNAWGGLGVAEATRLVDISLEVGLTMFDSAEHPAVAKLRNLDPNALTPIEALTLIAELKRSVGN